MVHHLSIGWAVGQCQGIWPIAHPSLTNGDIGGWFGTDPLSKKDLPISPAVSLLYSSLLTLETSNLVTCGKSAVSNVHEKSQWYRVVLGGWELTRMLESEVEETREFLVESKVRL
jgi:hypothetical protein